MAAEQVLIPGGKYLPFFNETKRKDVSTERTIAPFYMDVHPVTVREFNSFVEQFPQYRKSKVASLLAEKTYLENWNNDTLSKDTLLLIGDRPVTLVSWFVARKYCESQMKRLPRLEEWEYAGDVRHPEVLQRILNWYGQNGGSPQKEVKKSDPNKFGLHDMHGLIWEWVDDFNAVMISNDSRSKGDRTVGLFCGAGSLNSKDPSEYATFMRYGFRSGLKGRYCVANLGFRCASDQKE